VMKKYLLASDFDQTLSFNDSGIALSELLGIPGFREREATSRARRRSCGESETGRNWPLPIEQPAPAVRIHLAPPSSPSVFGCLRESIESPASARCPAGAG
jgi:hypothetical protein